jgi:septal ring factor EnvC (AmiA/AmiB activator)
MLKSETAMLKAEKDEILGSRQQRAEEARKQRELDQQRAKYRTSVADVPLVQELEVLKKRNSQLTRDLQYSESERQTTEQTLSRQIELLEKQISDQADTVVVAVDRSGGQAAGDAAAVHADPRSPGGDGRLRRRCGAHERKRGRPWLAAMLPDEPS